MTKNFWEIDFGSYDADDDSELVNYFLDDNYVDRIINGNQFFVIGRKGTGKSALCNWFKEQESENGYISSTLNFYNFPNNALLMLNDEQYQSTNQYRNIWLFMILSELSNLIIKDEKRLENDDKYIEIKSYIKQIYGENLNELHRKVIEVSGKSNGQLKINPLNIGKEKSFLEKYHIDNFENIELINNKLKNAIINYIKNYKNKLEEEDVKFLIQFDNLDSDYSSTPNKENYFNCIISLFKTVYDLNNELFMREKLPIKIIVFYPSDIYDMIHSKDRDSAKWKKRIFEINWNVQSRDDYKNGRLRKMVNLRIKNSLNESEYKDYWSLIVDNKKVALKDWVNVKGKRVRRTIDVFQYIVDNTLHRPRDVIMFCLEIVSEAKREMKLDYKVIKNAHRQFSSWFWDEICNETNQSFKNTNKLKNFLVKMGPGRYKYKEFEIIYKHFCATDFDFELTPLEFLDKMYNYGFIVNVDQNGDYTSIIRNEKSNFKKEYQFKLNKCLYFPLHRA